MMLEIRLIHHPEKYLKNAVPYALAKRVGLPKSDKFPDEINKNLTQ